jgi:hypothetical protein
MMEDRKMVQSRKMKMEFGRMEGKRTEGKRMGGKKRKDMGYKQEEDMQVVEVEVEEDNLSTHIGHQDSLGRNHHIAVDLLVQMDDCFYRVD